MALAEINANLPDTIGSADLTGSNNTKAGGIGPFTADDYPVVTFTTAFANSACPRR